MLRFRVARKLVALFFFFWVAVGGGEGGFEDKTFLGTNSLSYFLKVALSLYLPKFLES